MATFVVDKETTLLAYMLAQEPGMKRATAKTRLKHGAVTVNGAVATRHDASLQTGDVVEMHRRGTGVQKQSPRALKIVRQTNDWVVVEKPPGLLSVPTDDGGPRQRTALTEAMKALGTDRPLYACHRLDKDTSGLLLLAKSAKIQQHFFDTWDGVEKRYAAVVEGHPVPERGEIDVPLYDHPESLMAVPSRGPDAKEALTRYRVQDKGPERALVDIDLVTGRRHQIRSHFKDIGHPLCGDPRYGRGKRTGPRLCLHASALVFQDPASSRKVALKSPPPKLFFRILHQVDQADA